jgi:hypothetical protein
LNQHLTQPLAPDADPGTVFGVEMNPLDNTGGLQQIRPPQTQTGWARGVDIDWALVEDVQGSPDWNLLAGAETELDNAITAGLEPIVVVRGVPGWAQAVSGQGCGPILSSELAAFGDFMYALVSRYAGQVKYWELYNEPDIDPDLLADKNGPLGCWGDEDDLYYGGQYYAEMLMEVYPRIKEADPEAQVLVGGLLLDCYPYGEVTCPIDTPAKFLEGILLNEGGAHFDGIGFHAYDYYSGAYGHYENSNWGASWDTTGPVLTAKAQFIQDRLNDYGVTGKFVMNTEFALLWDTPGLDNILENTKASYIAQAYASAIASELKANIWYDVTGTWGRNNGLLVQDTLAPLNAYYSYQFASAKLKGATPLAPGIRFGEDVKFYAFDNASCGNAGGVDCNVWVLWSLVDLSTQVTLPAEPELVENIYGVDFSRNQTLTIPMSPYYIEVDAEAPGIDPGDLAPNPVEFNDPLTLSATISDTLNGGSPVFSATYSLDGGPWIDMDPLDGGFDEAVEEVTAPLTAPAIQGSYDYDFCIKGADVWGNATGAAVCTLVTLEVLDHADPLAIASDPGSVAYNQSLEISATISDSLTGGSPIQSAEYSLGGGGWTAMQAQDGVFDEYLEGVSATLTAPSTVGDYELCMRGTDSSGNLSTEDCTILSVFSPDGPQAYDLLVNPSPAKTNQALTISATIDDRLKGGVPVARAEYSLDGGENWSPMTALDGDFDEVVEVVSASINAPPLPGVYNLCVRGADSKNNLGGSICIELNVSYYTIGLSILSRDLFLSSIPLNGDYESGLDYWTSHTTFMPVNLVTEHPINRIIRPPDPNLDMDIPIGISSAVLGDPEAPCGDKLPHGPDVYAGLEQSVYIPKGSFSLQFKYVIYTQDVGVSDSGTFYDTFEVHINNIRQFFDGNEDKNETLKCRWFRVPSEKNPRSSVTSGWATDSVDLSPYAGQTVTISFRIYSRDVEPDKGWYNTYVFLDDVALIPNE